MTMAIAIAVFYALLESIIELLATGAVWVADRILDSSIAVFRANENIFETFINLIPFTQELHVMGIIKGIAYGILVLIVVVTGIKSIAMPISGEQTSPTKTLLRVAVTVVLIPLIFGVGYGGRNAGSTYVIDLGGGLLGLLGKWFGTILSYLGDVTSSTPIANPLGGALNGIDVAGYLGAVIILASIMTGVIGAAVTYVERIISLALYVIIGPICVTLNATNETSDTFKNWIIGLFTQFMAIFLSLIMWSAFKAEFSGAMSHGLFTATVQGRNGLLELAISLTLLNLMKNSEKILNALGIKTMVNADNARSITGGIATLGSMAMLAFQGTNAWNRAETKFRGPKGSAPVGVRQDGRFSPINSKGDLATKGLTTNIDGQKSMREAGGFYHTLHPSQYSTNTKNQSAGVNALKDAINGQQDNGFKASPISAQQVNTAFGFGRDTTVQAVGRKFSVASITDKAGNVHTGIYGNTSDFMYQDNIQSRSGGMVGGLMGDFEVDRGGQTQLLQDAFIPTTGANETLAPGTYVGVGHDGTYRYISENASGPMYDGSHQIYETVAGDAPQVLSNEQINPAQIENLYGENVMPMGTDVEYDHNTGEIIPEETGNFSEAILEEFIEGNKFESPDDDIFEGE